MRRRGKQLCRTEKKIQFVLNKYQRFEFRLNKIKTFPDTLYLAPEPASPFVAIIKAITAAFPRYPPYAGRHDSIVPHLSIACGHVDRWPSIENSIVSYFRSQGETVANCNSVDLIENCSGQWQAMHTFKLPEIPEDHQGQT